MKERIQEMRKIAERAKSEGEMLNPDWLIASLDMLVEFGDFGESTNQ